jgi:hypothetical protein
MSNRRPSWDSQAWVNWVVPHSAPELGARMAETPPGPGDGAGDGLVVAVGRVVLVAGLVVDGAVVVGGSGRVWKWGFCASRLNASSERAEVLAR